MYPENCAVMEVAINIIAGITECVDDYFTFEDFHSSIGTSEEYARETIKNLLHYGYLEEIPYADIWSLNSCRGKLDKIMYTATCKAINSEYWDVPSWMMR